MNFKSIYTVFVFITIFLITGCSVIPPPNSIIRPPEYPQAAINIEEDLKLIARNFLPQGTKFIYPVHPKGADAVQIIDLEGDGRSEILVTYKGNEVDKGSGAFILKKKNNDWQKIWEDKYMINVIGLDWAKFIDITDDNIPELLLGWNLGFQVGYNLDIFTFKNTPKKVSSIKYNELDVANIEGGTENDRKPEIIIVKKEEDQREDDVPPVVLRWYESGLVPAEDVYPVFYKDRINTFKESLSLYDKNFMEWYYLSDMLVKANRPLEAIESIERAIKNIKPHYEKYRIRLEIMKGEALIKADKFVEGRDVLKNIVYRHDITKISCTNDELTLIYLNLGRAYMGLYEYETAKLQFNKAYDIVKSAYTERSEAFILNSYTVRRELDRLEALMKLLNL